MIRLDRIIVHEFRGIRDLTLNLGGGNFAACGPNGTGKSGIVDAIEFGLTGSISRLSGAGTGGLSVKLHGPHVDSRANPGDAHVTLDVVIPSMGGKRATIRRSVKAANVPTITPDDLDVKAAFAWVSSHPEFVLSRRELIRYVLAEAGQRAKEVQALLRLEDIEKLRAILQKISNACAKELSQLTRIESVAETQLQDALMLPQLTASGLLSAVNGLRSVIGLAPLVAIDVTTSLKMGLEVTAETPAPARVPKTQAAADLTTMTAALDILRSSTFQTACVTAATKATELGADAGSVEVVSREALLRAALDLYDGKVCPVCDTEFEPDAFCMHVEGKLEQFTAVTAKRKVLEARIAPLLDQIHAAGAALTTVIDHCKK